MLLLYHVGNSEWIQAGLAKWLSVRLTLIWVGVLELFSELGG